eukprot:2295562-Rhodomonas_salina.1
MSSISRGRSVSPSRSPGSGLASGPMVPRQLLDDANEGVERLKKKLDETTVHNKREMDNALKAMQWQLKTLQSQYRTAEDQLKRSMEREKDLRDQLANQDVSSLLTTLREECDGLRRENDQLRDELDTVDSTMASLKAQEAEASILSFRCD